MHEAVSLAGESRPAATAIVMGPERISFGQLEATSNRLARLLIARGVRPGNRVALLQPKAPIAIISMLASLKPGAIYVPIDVASPPARVQKILDSASPRVVLASSRASALAAGLKITAEIGSVEGLIAGAAFGPSDIASAEDSPISIRSHSTAPAHILFTSGSTGDPKGVVITHAMVTAFLDWAVPYFGLSANDRISCHLPLHFDLSTFDIYGAMSTGAELHLVPPDAFLPHNWPGSSAIRS